MANRKGYQAIKAEAERIGWPTIYCTDLMEHDQNILSRPTAPREFGWALREHGTHLFYRPSPRLELYWANLISRCPKSRLYWFDGEELRQVMPGKWLDLLCPSGEE